MNFSTSCSSCCACTLDLRYCSVESTETLAFFCHLGLGNALIAHLSGLSLPAIWHTVFLPTSSVTMVYMERHRTDPIAHARFVGIGDTSHLFAGGEPISCSGLFTDQLR